MYMLAASTLQQNVWVVSGRRLADGGSVGQRNRRHRTAVRTFHPRGERLGPDYHRWRDDR
jgi:hypothetical protein